MPAIVCVDAGKAFRRFSERNQTLKQVLARRRRAVFDEHWAVRGLTLAIEEGETFGLIGGNGAGKSTTLKLLAGILVPDEGTVAVNGRVSALLELGAGFHPELSGRENVFLNGAILGMSRRTIRQRFDEIVEFSGLEEFIDSPVKTYSSGMFARLGFSVAVNVDPEVLLLDEVLAVGDESFQRKSAECIADLRRSGKTVVIVSHGLGALQTMCNRVAWIDHGAVRAIGPSAAVIEQYLDSTIPNHVVDDRGRIRLGTGLARVEVMVVPASLETGAEAGFAFDVVATTAVGPCRLSAAFVRADGVQVASVATLVDVGVGGQRCTYTAPRLPLPPGLYDIAVKLVSSDDTAVHDACDHLCRFAVHCEAAMDVGGPFAALLGQWTETAIGRGS